MQMASAQGRHPNQLLNVYRWCFVGYIGSSRCFKHCHELLLNILLTCILQDFEQAAWQLTYLCLAPRRVYRNVYFHKQTKNQWARDDPAILVLIGACLGVAAIAWSLVYSYSIFEAIELVFLMIARDFLLSGIIIATIL
ncbi:hypothetical protein MPER_04683, partial [Moniliophthora perniciosa FA553]